MSDIAADFKAIADALKDYQIYISEADFDDDGDDQRKHDAAEEARGRLFSQMLTAIALLQLAQEVMLQEWPEWQKIEDFMRDNGFRDQPPPVRRQIQVRKMDIKVT